MTQAFSHWPLMEEAQVSLYGCSGECEPRLSPVNIIPLVLSILIYHLMVGGCTSGLFSQH